MAQLAPQEPPAPSFAGLLAEFAKPDDPPAGSSRCFQDDVVTLSYESALQARTRNRPAPPPAPAAGATPASVQSRIQQSRKRASVTLRMSNAECAQLQQRAAEAGITVSAYLRSCAFEVEELRAQVKQALAELRSAQTSGPQVSRPRSPLLRLFHRQPAAPAPPGVRA